MGTTDHEIQKIIETGYDRISGQYTYWAKTQRGEERQRYTDFLLENLDEGALVLELGCGSGDPTTRQLASRFQVVGVDLSGEQLRRARLNVPSANLLHADITQIEFLPGSFAAVAAFYTITHVPRRQHRALMSSIFEWLTPGGIFVASMSAGPLVDSIEEWLGVPMYFSGYSSATNRKIVTGAGFEILQAKRETAAEMGRSISFLWIIAQKPRL